MSKDKTSSPKGGNRGCLCADGTYSIECCDGELQSQGVGSLVQSVASTIVNTNSPRVLITTSN
jgi:hypothetical protein